MARRGAPRFSCLSVVVVAVVVVGLVVAGLVVTLKYEARRDLKRTEKLALEHARHWADVVAGQLDAGASPVRDSLRLDFWEVKVRVVTLDRTVDGITGIVKAEELRTTTFGKSTIFRCFSYDIPVKGRPEGRFTVVPVACPPVLPGVGGGT
ncbi:hypothetical protein [Yinghuangia soli]|uniref:Uncharacterized protein n=1 Tax=Yinghuangia soli TaxID=2908204 RepID=A0AA41PXK2_9ACTN|nr:hypothetical protein [Yinghuangia soli]MCF2527583.1 hypothetical protein [Yinghuangia soli]